ncbi:dehydration-responsive element-binding protein 1E-like [Cicer arietinum]|uniref:Dehydration-responsive element-binding protein 1E-like n=1 Tax=Cicer arietinum TaxID=3827 RepID=A0A1S2YXP5_CICAR|nr:dehydration-responsive element-binding protein 1E-like [Cicer arietinum]
MSNRGTSSCSSSSEPSCITTTDDKKQVKYHSDEEVILATTRPKKRSGRRVFRETRHPVYRGVRARDNNKWVCEMRVPNTINSKIWLGTYPTPQMAARAHDLASLTLRGTSACLNFADSAWRLTLPESTDAVEIRKAAMKAAELIAAEDEINKQRDQQCVNEDPSNYEGTSTMNVEQLVSTSETEEMHDLILNIANEPLMSPPMSPPHSTRDYASDYLADMDIFDTQVNQTRMGKGHKGTTIIGTTLFFTKCYILMSNRVVLRPQIQN